MRTGHKLSRFFAAAILLGSVPSIPATGAHIWWIGEEGDLWTDGDNWFGVATVPGPPTPDIQTFVTTSGHDAFMGVTLIDETAVGVSSATAGSLYIGGWHEFFDSLPEEDPNGDPKGHFGVVEITGGRLDVQVQKAYDAYLDAYQAGEDPLPPKPNPPCYYTRLGTRGAHGSVVQSGGEFETCGTITFGWETPASVGTYEISGGVLQPLILGIGTGSTGILEMTGGRVKRLSPSEDQAQQEENAHGHPQRDVTIYNHILGWGYQNDVESYEPGVGLLHASGNARFDGYGLVLGRNPGSIGTLAVHDSARVVVDRLVVGEGAMGSVAQSGGQIVAIDSVVLAAEEWSMGQVTVSGGTFASTSLVNGGLDPVLGARGMGNLIVVGSEPRVFVTSSYVQNGRSRLTFLIDDNVATCNSSGSCYGRIPLDVNGSATFHAGSTLHLDLVRKGNFGSPEFVPERGQVFSLMDVSAVVTDLGLELQQGDDRVWDHRFVVSPAGRMVLEATYCPVGATALECMAP